VIVGSIRKKVGYLYLKQPADLRNIVIAVVIVILVIIAAIIAFLLYRRHKMQLAKERERIESTMLLMHDLRKLIQNAF